MTSEEGTPFGSLPHGPIGGENEIEVKVQSMNIANSFIRKTEFYFNEDYVRENLETLATILRAVDIAFDRELIETVISVARYDPEDLDGRTGLNAIVAGLRSKPHVSRDGIEKLMDFERNFIDNFIDVFDDNTPEELRILQTIIGMVSG